MSYKRVYVMDIKEIIRRWQDKQSLSEMSQSIVIDRKRVRKYIKLQILFTKLV